MLRSLARYSMWKLHQNQPSLAKAVLMVRPVDFQYNFETAVDNIYQHSSVSSHDGVTATAEQVKSLALNEFEVMIEKIRNSNIEVMVLEKRDINEEETTIDAPTPDAVFPNNWFATTAEGTVFLFPMAVPSRIAERRPFALKRLFESNGFEVKKIENVGAVKNPIDIELERMNAFEGTGAMVIDKVNNCIYAALSVRCNLETLLEFAASLNHRCVHFRTQGSSGTPVYHTNVVMSIGEKFAVVCFECIVPEDRERVRAELLAAEKEIIEISLPQMEKSFCANLLELQSLEGKHYVALSRSAWEGFDGLQRERLQSFAEPIICDIPTIERIGGGSVRCMLAEIFLPKRK